MAHLVVPGPVRASCGPAAQKGSGQTRGGGGQQGSSCSGSHSLPPLALGPQLKGKSILLPSSPGQEAGFRRQSPRLQAGHCLLGAPAGIRGRWAQLPAGRRAAAPPEPPSPSGGARVSGQGHLKPSVNAHGTAGARDLQGLDSHVAQGRDPCACATCTMARGHCRCWPLRVHSQREQEAL